MEGRLTRLRYYDSYTYPSTWGCPTTKKALPTLTILTATTIHQPSNKSLSISIWWVSSIRLAAGPRPYLSNQIKASKQCKSKDTKAHPQTTCTRVSLPKPKDFAGRFFLFLGIPVAWRGPAGVCHRDLCTIKHFKSRSLFLS